MTTWIVVEDEPEIYDLLNAMLTVWGVTGRAFLDAEEAIAWVDKVDQDNRGSELPILALIDIRLPVRSGVEVAQRLRRSSKLNNITIVLITAYRMVPIDEIKVKKASQADALLYKPLPHMQDFKRQLESLIQKRQQNKP